MAKEKCNCGKIAVWLYMPGYSGGGNPYHCDDCISSPEDEGCSCNYNHGDELPEGIEGKDWRWIDQETNRWIKLDEKGRPYPCIEYDYDAKGYKIPTIFDKIKFNFSWRYRLVKISLKSFFKK